MIETPGCLCSLVTFTYCNLTVAQLDRFHDIHFNMNYYAFYLAGISRICLTSFYELVPHIIIYMST